ncbi:MAG: peptidase G2, partial [Staphylococcus equorum]|nr:peptidase G2 [Staphylococcus equorum]
NNVVSINPFYNKVYEGTTPRAMVIAAYEGVVVNNLTCIGDNRFSDDNPVVAVQYMANNVHINNVNISGFKNSLADLKIYGDGEVKNVSFSNVNIHNSSVNRGIAGGSSVKNFSINHVNMIGNGQGNGIELYDTSTELIGLNVDNYENNLSISGDKYDVPPTVINGGFRGGSSSGGAIKDSSVLLASSGGSYANDNNSFVLGSNIGSQSYGTRSGIINSASSETLKDSYAQTIMNSRSVKSLGNYHIQMGYGDTEEARTSNTKIDMNTFGGDISVVGSLKSSQDIGDIGEYFESEDGNEIENGFIVSMNGRYIRKAQKGDKPIGVVSGTAGLVMGDQLFHHKSKFKKDKFGVTLTKLVENKFVDDDGVEHVELMDQPIINDDYNDSEEESYQSRSERPEWAVVGLTGQIYTRIDNTVEVNDTISAVDGIGTKDNENGYWQVEAITTPYDKQSGYGVAIVLVK